MKTIWRKIMEIQIKKAVKAGNSSAVILPRSWLHKEVRVELVKKTPQLILIEVIEILKNYIGLDSVIGIYLVGSYARGDEDSTSDIDVLVLTRSIDREMLREGIYNILIISSELLQQKLGNDLLPIGQMIKEAKPLLNSNYLGSIEVKVTRRNIQWYVETTEEKLKMLKRIIDWAQRVGKKYLDSRIAYTLVLRIRTLYIIDTLIKKNNYSKKDFIRLMKTVSKGTNAYEGYLGVKNDIEKKQDITLEETERLYDYLRNQLEKVRKQAFMS